MRRSIIIPLRSGFHKAGVEKNTKLKNTNEVRGKVLTLGDMYKLLAVLSYGLNFTFDYKLIVTLF